MGRHFSGLLHIELSHAKEISHKEIIHHHMLQHYDVVILEHRENYTAGRLNGDLSCRTPFLPWIIESSCIQSYFKRVTQRQCAIFVANNIHT